MAYSIFFTLGKLVTQKKAALLICLIFSVLLSACAGVERNIVGLGDDVFESTEIKGATTVRLFVATTRQRSNNTAVFFDGNRSQKMHLGYMDVSVPESHKTGQIERPKNRKADPSRHFVLSRPTLLDNAKSFQSELDAALSKRPHDKKDVLVFVHGYNTNFSAAALLVAQFVHDINYDGIPILFSWASRGQKLDYLYDLNSALQSRDELERLGVILTGVQATHFDVVAHSMGNLATLEAMRKLERRRDLNSTGRLRHVILASPDLDIDLFEAQLKDFRKIQDRFTVLVSGDDRALSLSRRLAGGISRVGATDPIRLAELGLNVIDLTEIHDKSSSNHTKFASSPDIVKLIGRGINAGNSLSAQITPSTVKVLAGGLLRGVTLIPTSIVNSAHAGVVTLGN